jgi:hypothetical protein
MRVSLIYKQVRAAGCLHLYKPLALGFCYGRAVCYEVARHEGTELSISALTKILHLKTNACARTLFYARKLAIALFSAEALLRYNVMQNFVFALTTF